jgi:hypothetical protein
VKEELVLEPSRVEMRHCAPSRNSARAADSPSEKPPPWLFFHPDVTFLEKRHQLAYPESRASDGSWKEQPKVFQQLNIIGSAEGSALADISARSPAFVTGKESPRGIGKAMHSCPSSYESQPETSPSSIRQVNCSARREMRRER